MLKLEFSLVQILTFSRTDIFVSWFQATVTLLFFNLKNYCKKYSHVSKQTKKQTPPKAYVGLFHTIKLLSGNDFPWFLLKTAKELQSFVFQLNLKPILRCPMVVAVGDPDDAHAIFMDRFTTKPESLCKTFNDVNIGIPSIFTSNGDVWHSRRKSMAPAFSSRHIKRMNKVASEKIDEWIRKRLLTLITRNEAFDVGKEMVDVTLSGISETAFEYQMSKHERDQFVHDLQLCFKEFCFKTSLNPMRKIFGPCIAERRQAHDAAHRIHSLSLKIINSYRQVQNPTKDTIIDRIMNDTKSYKNDAERAADVTVLLVAGHDTTAYTVAWTLKELAKNPKEQQKLRDSLRLIGEDGSREKCSVLGKVVKESMRLHPVAAGASIRTIGRNLATKNYYFPKGTIAFIPLILLHRNSDIFENPNCFKPSRWDKPTSVMNQAFRPFSAGKQNCIGQSLAKAQIHTIISKICGKFELELVDEGRTDFFLFLRPVNTMIRAKGIH